MRNVESQADACSPGVPVGELSFSHVHLLHMKKNFKTIEYNKKSEKNTTHCIKSRFRRRGTLTFPRFKDTAITIKLIIKKIRTKPG